MHRFQGFGIFFVEVDAGDAGVVHLLEEFLQVRPPLMIHPCSGKEPACVPALEDADTEVDVLSETHPGEAAERFINLATHSHIETPRIEFVHFLFSAADAAGGEERSHGVVDGFLYIGKGDVRTVRSAECIGRDFLQFLFHCCKIAFGKDAVGIQYNQVFSPAAFGAVIARLSGTGVGFGVVTDVQNVLITLCNVLAGNRRTVLYDNDFEILEALSREALQKLVRFVGAVVYGNDNGISHVSVSFYRVTGVDVAKIRFYLVTDGYFAVHSDCYFRFVLSQSLKMKIICYVITLQGYAFDYKCVVP